MTRAEAYNKLEYGYSVTHPNLHGIPIKQIGYEIYYEIEHLNLGNIELPVQNKGGFFIEKQTNDWDTGWEIVNK